MSLHVTVPGNPLIINRNKALLTDVELAKKNEWNRRRKLRLQQVRQQAKDLACTLLHKVRTEEQNVVKEQGKTKQKEVKDRQKREIDKCQKEFEQCVSAIGNAHQSAAMEVTSEKLVKEQRDVLSAISRARGALAAERLRANKKANREKEEAATRCRDLVRNIENVRANLVAQSAPVVEVQNKPCLKRSAAVGENCKTIRKKSPQKAKSKQGLILRGEIRRSENVPSSTFPLKDSTNESGPYRPEKFSDVQAYRNIESQTNEGPFVLGSPRKVQKSLGSILKSSSSGPSSELCGGSSTNPSSSTKTCRKEFKFTSRNRSPCKYSKNRDDVQRKQGASTYSKESTPPRSKFVKERTPSSKRCHNISECYYDSDESDDSTVTWPLRTPKHGKCYMDSPKVQLYDHSGRLCQEYVRPSNSVTHIEPGSQQVYLNDDTIIEEEGRVLKIELEERDRKRVERGNKALRKDRLRADFDQMIRELKTVDKAERLKRINSQRYLTAAHMSDDRLKERERLRQFRLEKAFKPVYNEICKDWENRSAEPSSPLQQSPRSKVRWKPVTVIEDMSHVKRFPVEYKFGSSPNSLIARSEKTLKQLLEKVQMERQHLLECSKSKIPTERTVETDEEVEIPTWMMEPEGDKSGCGGNEHNNEPNCDSSTLTTDHSPKMIRVEAMVHGVPEDSKNVTNNSEINTSVKGTSIKSPQKSTSTPEERPPKQEKKKDKNEPKDLEKIDVCSSLPENNQTPITNENVDDKTDSSGFNSTLKDDSNAKDSSTSKDDSFSKDSSSFEGIEVIVKVCEKKYKSKVSKGSPSKFESRNRMKNGEVNSVCRWENKLGDKETNTSSSTSYLSPPEHLNPSQLNLLSSVLSRVKEKNDNPKLKEYILRLLKMSRESVDELSISVSDVSVQSEIINTSFDKDVMRDSARLGEASNKVDEVNVDGRKITETPRIPRTYEKPFLNALQRPEELSQRYKDAEIQCFTNKDNQSEQTSDNGEVFHYSELAERYSERITALARMIDNCHLSKGQMLTRGERHFNDTSYLSVPSEIDESVRISCSVRDEAESAFVQRPEQSFDYNSNALHRLRYFSAVLSENLQSNLNVASEKPKLREEDIAALGLSMKILPRPDDVAEEEISKPRPKPPPSLYSAQKRTKFPSGTAVPHELSTIVEIDTSSSQVLGSSGEKDFRLASSEMSTKHRELGFELPGENLTSTASNHTKQPVLYNPTHFSSVRDHGQISQVSVAGPRSHSRSYQMPRETEKSEQNLQYGVPDKTKHFSDNSRVNQLFQDRLSSLVSKNDRLNNVVGISDSKCKPSYDDSNESFTSINSDIESQISSVRALTPIELHEEETLLTGGKKSEQYPCEEQGSVNSSLSLLSHVSDFSLLSENELNGMMESSSDDFEDIFRSLGIGWALATLRKTKEAKKLSLDSSSSNSRVEKREKTSTKSGDKSNSQSSKYIHSTPVKKSEERSSGRNKSNNQSEQASFGASIPSSLTPLWSSDTLSLTPPSLTLSTPYLELASSYQSKKYPQ